jgi:hypothetical protein
MPRKRPLRRGWRPSEFAADFENVRQETRTARQTGRPANFNFDFESPLSKPEAGGYFPPPRRLVDEGFQSGIHTPSMQMPTPPSGAYGSGDPQGATIVRGNVGSAASDVGGATGRSAEVVVDPADDVRDCGLA